MNSEGIQTEGFFPGSNGESPIIFSQSNSGILIPPSAKQPSLFFLNGELKKN